MHFKRHLELEHGLKQIDMVPFLNLSFLLFIFFMLTAGFLTQPAIGVSLPKAVSGTAVTASNVEIIISKENIISVNGKAVSAREIAELLKQAAKRNQSVMIKSDKQASLGSAVEIWDICRQAGISQINIATDQK